MSGISLQTLFSRAAELSKSGGAAATVMSKIAENLEMRKLGSGSANKPIAVVIVSGPPRSGKTTLAYEIAEAINTPVTNIHMCEFSEAHDRFKFTGIPRGYIGHGSDSTVSLISKVGQPTILVLDEPHKAHESVLKDAAWIVADAGQSLPQDCPGPVNLTQAIIVFTTTEDPDVFMRNLAEAGGAGYTSRVSDSEFVKIKLPAPAMG